MFVGDRHLGHQPHAAEFALHRRQHVVVQVGDAEPGLHGAAHHADRMFAAALEHGEQEARRQFAVRGLQRQHGRQLGRGRGEAGARQFDVAHRHGCGGGRQFALQHAADRREVGVEVVGGHVAVRERDLVPFDAAQQQLDAVERHRFGEVQQPHLGVVDRPRERRRQATGEQVGALLRQRVDDGGGIGAHRLAQQVGGELVRRAHRTAF